MITLEAFYMGRDKAYKGELTDELRQNAEDMVTKANLLLQRYCAATGDPELGVRSGWRPPEVNFGVPGAAPQSKHMKCNAIDLADMMHKIKSWCVSNLDVLEEIGLWMEAPECTPTWLHVQRVPPGSGHRVFIA